MDFQQKKTVRMIMYSKVTLFVLFVLVVLFCRGVWNVYQKEKFSRDGLAVAEKKYADLSVRKDFLESQIQKMKTEEGLEEEIRNKFSVTKKGEVSVLIVDSSSSTVEDSGDKIQKSLWQSFLDLFK